MNKPHRYADVIKAWADGIPIQYRYCDGRSGWDDLRGLVSPNFSAVHITWRIKPTAPQEPDYGEICRNTWAASSTSRTCGDTQQSGWRSGANAVIEAYKAHQQALADFEGNT